MTAKQTAVLDPDERPRPDFIKQVIEETLRRQTKDLISTRDDAEAMAQHFFDSGYYSDVRNPAQAFAKIMAGRDFGFPPAASMMLIHVIEGAPALSANALACLMERAGYTWKYLQHDDEGCIIQLTSPKGKVFDALSWGRKEAEQAELLGRDKTGQVRKNNWRQYPRAMFRARCLSEVARAYAPGVFGGITPYIAEELGAETDEQGAPLGSLESEAVTPEVSLAKMAMESPGRIWIPSQDQLNRCALVELRSREEVLAAWAHIAAEFKKVQDGEEFWRWIAKNYGPDPKAKGSAGSLDDARTAILVGRKWRDDNMSLWRLVAGKGQSDAN